MNNREAELLGHFLDLICREDICDGFIRPEKGYFIACFNIFEVPQHAQEWCYTHAPGHHNDYGLCINVFTEDTERTHTFYRSSWLQIRNGGSERTFLLNSQM